MRLATTNQAKYAGMESLLESSGIVFTPPPVKLLELQSLDLMEVGEYKAISLYDVIKQPVIVDDAGLLLDAYQNFPGAMTKSILKSIGIAGIQRLLEGKIRTAQLVCTITLCSSREDIVHFQGVLKGHIGNSSVIKGKLPLNSVFIPGGEEHPLESLKQQFPNYPDHRIIAFRKLADYLSNLSLTEASP